MNSNVQGQGLDIMVKAGSSAGCAELVLIKK